MQYNERPGGSDRYVPQKQQNFSEKILDKFYMLSDILYPPVCPVCKRPLLFRQGGGLIHPSCYARLHKAVPPLCMKCGKPLKDARQEYCYDCSRHRHSFESGHGLWVYDKISSEIVFLYKYGGKRELSVFFASALAQEYGAWIRQIHPDILVPVPLSREKMRSRGFNQAELIARRLGDEMGIECESRALVRVKSTIPQKSLDPGKRQENIRKAFSADPAYLKGVKRVLLIDDVYTTGATIQYCSRALRAAAGARVWFLTLCIGAPF